MDQINYLRPCKWPITTKSVLNWGNSNCCLPSNIETAIERSHTMTLLYHVGISGCWINFNLAITSRKSGLWHVLINTQINWLPSTMKEYKPYKSVVLCEKAAIMSYQWMLDKLVANTDRQVLISTYTWVVYMYYASTLRAARWSKTFKFVVSYDKRAIFKWILCLINL